MSWIGVDLDGTLATYDMWRGLDHIGKPIPLMVKRVKQWIKDKKEVRIVTARVSMGQAKKAEPVIEKWLEQQGLPKLRITCSKDHEMLQLWDDRCIQMITNTGETLEDYYKKYLHELTGNMPIRQEKK